MIKPLRFKVVRLSAWVMMIGVSSARGNVAVTNLFSNHMVLQRNTTVPVWGTGSSGEQVTVTFNGQTKTAQTTNGKWKVHLDPMIAGGPFTMNIKGNNTITITDVYMGEVWNCAGQSNMDTRVSFYSGYKNIQNSTNIPLLHYYTLRQPSVSNPAWETCTTPTSVGNLSCLGFFFGREIQKDLENIAVGLIVTAVGGTTIASWLDPETVAADPSIKSSDNSAGGMYKSWVAPVVGCAMRGTVWMQGEQDRTGTLAPLYGERFKLLISSWRKLWGIGDFPFYYVQLANKTALQTMPYEGGTTAVIREGQRLALALANTVMVSAIDIGDVNEIHFPDKLDAGIRLALPAKALCYGQPDLVYSGPLYVSKTITGNKINCKFVFTGSGLTGKDGAILKGFGIAGSDGRFVFGDAVIQGNIVTVSSPSISTPTQVCYGYATNPVGNLYNKEGLPASPFLTTSPDLEEGTVAIKQQLPGVVRPIDQDETQQEFWVNVQGRKIPASPIAGMQVIWKNDKGMVVRGGKRFHDGVNSR